MPGRGSYGPAGKWVYDRAHRIMEEGDTQEQYGGEKGKQVAYALATQQAHKMGKAPKKKGGYGTPKGRKVAKAKFDLPKKEYQKTAEALVDELNKISSLAGQDLKKPFMGNPQFPTEDSKMGATSFLNRSQSSAEVGPTPTLGELKPKGPDVQDLTPKMGTNKGSLPKIGSDERISNDPLIQYLQKHGEELDTNIADLPGDDGDEPELVSHEDMPPSAQKGTKSRKDELEALFDNKDSFAYNYTEHHTKSLP